MNTPTLVAPTPRPTHPAYTAGFAAGCDRRGPNPYKIGTLAWSEFAHGRMDGLTSIGERTTLEQELLRIQTIQNAGDVMRREVERVYATALEVEYA